MWDCINVTVQICAKDCSGPPPIKCLGRGVEECFRIKEAIVGGCIWQPTFLRTETGSHLSFGKCTGITKGTSTRAIQTNQGVTLNTPQETALLSPAAHLAMVLVPAKDRDRTMDVIMGMGMDMVKDTGMGMIMGMAMGTDMIMVMGMDIIMGMDMDMIMGMDMIMDMGMGMGMDMDMGMVTSTSTSMATSMASVTRKESLVMGPPAVPAAATLTR
ncbi:uncharacterized protein LOC129187895 [Dunckerocampus dactyliophorus]|uniref:uncharacterized protein LOC129187895 n=1 Tax=Dunckerocampus dactyliophorus TaxID=161453 RepID=UPI0024067920|nr:uncharacterized protein LOC129187895 [Dunckerocampus dactyliophorus]